MTAGETLFLLTGVYITYCIRNARREIYKEKWTLCSIVYLELVISTVTYVLRHIFYQSIHPDLIFMLYFTRCQLTVTLSLILLFFPKVSCTASPVHSGHQLICLVTLPESLVSLLRLLRQQCRPSILPLTRVVSLVTLTSAVVPQPTADCCFQQEPFTLLLCMRRREPGA